MNEHISIDEYRYTNQKVSKYGNRKTMYKGEMYDSKKEADYAQTLDLMTKARDAATRVQSYERQVPYPIFVREKKICTYLADFVVMYADGGVEVVDVKGVKTDVYKLKKKLVEALYDIQIMEI